MAITGCHWEFIRQLHERGMLPRRGRILELGRANWYGDVVPDAMIHDGEKCDIHVPPELAGRRLEHEHELYELADYFYRVYFNPAKIYMIDRDPTALSLPTVAGLDRSTYSLDLNEPLPLRLLRLLGEYGTDYYDVVYNHGTAEHIFNIGQFYRTCHETVAPGGLMIHEGPFTGWPNHGFYGIQPTLYYDLAHDNEYKVEMMCMVNIATRRLVEVKDHDHICEMMLTGLAPGMYLMCALRAPKMPRQFVYPIQAAYRPGGKTPLVGEAWHSCR